MVAEAKVEQLPGRPRRRGPGWFVLNARDARWWQRDRARPLGDLEGDGDFAQLGMRIAVLQPGEPSGMYHAETGQEDFLVVSGECVLVIEGEERQLKAWDFVHCPPWTGHTFRRRRRRAVRHRHGRCTDGRNKIVYPVNEVAATHGSSVEKETPQPKEAYAPYPARAALHAVSRGRPPGRLALAARGEERVRQLLGSLNQPGVLDPLRELFEVDRVEVDEHAGVTLVVRRLEIEVGPRLEHHLLLVAIDADGERCPVAVAAPPGEELPTDSEGGPLPGSSSASGKRQRDPADVVPSGHASRLTA